MTITMLRATAGMVEGIIDAVSSWQYDGAPVQVHPGDIGWNTRSSAADLADELRVWQRDGALVAVGMTDVAGDIIRMAIAPAVTEDDDFAAHLVADLSDPTRGLLAAEFASAEVRFGTAVQRLLTNEGWTAGETWTPLRRDLSDSVQPCGLRVEALSHESVRNDVVRDRVAVQRSAFPNSTFTVEKWRAMSASPAYRNARCLVAYDGSDAVAATTVWSAGVGRPGLIESLGVDASHVGKGYGTAITLAAASQLQSMGASSVTVCTPSRNVAAVATYVAAGMQRCDDVADFARPSRRGPNPSV